MRNKLTSSVLTILAASASYSTGYLTKSGVSKGRGESGCKSFLRATTLSKENNQHGDDAFTPADDTEYAHSRRSLLSGTPSAIIGISEPPRAL